MIIILLLLYKIITFFFSENSIRDESSVFKISKLDSPKRIRVSSLVSDQEYQIWLEAYLTNGKTIQSNVLTFHTDTVDPSALPTTRDEGMMEEHSYYSSMVAAAIVATFALMGLAIILYFYLRRHTTYKVAFDIDHTMAFNVLLDAKRYVFFRQRSQRTALPATQAQPMITLPSKTLTEVLHHRWNKRFHHKTKPLFTFSWNSNFQISIDLNTFSGKLGANF